MRHNYSLTTAPQSEPITSDQATAHVRVDSEEDFTYLEELIPVAREYVDSMTGRVSSSCGWKMVTDSWDSAFGSTAWDRKQIISLYRVPLVSVESVKYYAPDATSLTTIDAADYAAIISTEPGGILFLEDVPQVDTTRPDAIQIEFTAGYSQPALAPAILRHAVKMMVAHFYEQRTPVAFASASEIPFGLKTMIENQKVGGWVG